MVWCAINLERRCLRAVATRLTQLNLWISTALMRCALHWHAVQIQEKIKHLPKIGLAAHETLRQNYGMQRALQ